MQARVLVIEQSAPRMRWLDADTFHDRVIDIISEVKILTGALVYPDGTPEQLVQVEVVKRFLASTPGFYSLNHAEIVQAFYMNAGGLFPETFRHYNRELNAEFLGDVLQAYVRYKAKNLGPHLGAIQNLIAPPTPQPAPVLDMTDWMDMVNEDLALVHAGQADMIFSAVPKYKLLRRLGYIEIRSRKHWWSWYQWSARNREALALRIVAKTEGEKADRARLLDALSAIVERAEIDRGQHRGNVDKMRRDIYVQHLKALASCGIADIFEQVETDRWHPDPYFS